MFFNETTVMNSQKTLMQIFLWPCLIAVVCVSGLVVALLIDDPREYLADVMIALPAFIAVYGYLAQRFHRFK